MQEMVKVLKLDGSTEDFDLKKIKRVVVAAGLTEEQGQKLVDNIGQWAISLNKTTVSVKDIRDQVYEGLKKVSSYAAGLFSWYEKTKDK